MNTIGVVLSFSAMAVALIELRMRSDLAGRRIGALLALCAWLSMACVAWDCHQQCRVLMSAKPVMAAEGIAAKHHPEIAIEWPDGTKLEQYATSGATHLVGSEKWHASQQDRL